MMLHYNPAIYTQFPEWSNQGLGNYGLHWFEWHTRPVWLNTGYGTGIKPVLRRQAVTTQGPNNPHSVQHGKPRVDIL